MPDQKGMTDEERIQLLKDHFLRGEISEQTYQELRTEIEERLKQKASSIQIGDVGMIKGNVHAETKIDSHKIDAPTQIIGGVHIKVGNEKSAEVKPEMGRCPICGRYLERTQSFICKKCGREWICTSHQEQLTFFCSDCYAIVEEQKRKEFEIRAAEEEKTRKELEQKKLEQEREKREKEQEDERATALGCGLWIALGIIGGILGYFIHGFVGLIVGAIGAMIGFGLIGAIFGIWEDKFKN